MQQSTPPFSNKLISWRQGKIWFEQGLHDFKALKNQWYLVCLLLVLVISAFSQFAPVATALVVVMISPVVAALMMGLCRCKAEQLPVQFSTVWQKIRSRFNDFFMLGVLSVLLSFLFQQIHTQMLLVLGLPIELTEAMVKNMSGKEALIRTVLNLMTNLPVAMALAFSPALLLFNGSRPLVAIKSSFFAVVRAWKAFVVLVLMFFLLFMAVLIFASLIMTVILSVLGAASHFLVNVIVLFFVFTVAGIGICAQYQAYVDIFEQDQNEQQSETAEIYTEI